MQHGTPEANIARFGLYDQDAGSLIVEATRILASQGAEIRDIHVARPSLEDVFLYLTGRNIR